VRVGVRVPATSANLGPGFDCFGLALDLCNEATVDTEAAPGVSWQGEGADELPIDGSDMVTRAMRAVADRMRIQLPPFALRSVNEVPLERGLGSSSAAAVAGVMLASGLLDLGIQADPYSVFSLAAEIEGHPDNAAAAVYGGFTIVADGTVRRLDPHPEIRPVVLVPGHVRLPTHDARRALPADVSRADAVFNAAHAAMTVLALTGDPSLLTEAVQDRLHQRIRLELVPETEDAFELLRDANVPVCVSGAGPSLLAFEWEGRLVPTAEELGLDPRWRVLRPSIRSRGAELVEE
jgi:homoserine kinase